MPIATDNKALVKVNGSVTRSKLKQHVFVQSETSRGTEVKYFYQRQAKNTKGTFKVENKQTTLWLK